MTLNDSTLQWQRVVDITNDRNTGIITASLGHFSIYALFGSPAAATLDEAKVYPSPWKVGTSGRFDASELTVTNLTEEGTVRIYTLGAQLVKKLTYDLSNAGTVTWDGKDSGGEKARSGV